MSVLDSFEQFREMLARQVSIAEDMGMSQDMLTDLSNQVAEFLSNNVEPRTQEQKILKELWEVATEEEKNTLSKLLLKMVENTQIQH
ncbi:DUF3243 family protein [Fuchsiella alkaliacetigena]|uniref:DUF3243 family protein n=1 Tax=Fuchsiella alkaliacetigena TaxID=957042 RepID=UPI00200AC600|nr:DUF3243 family protein [Fuchsiella alkaliacetigena]MCK8824948.1 DUF3243 domain-containing protein [Fuchsiella alkaliacetigena]